MAATLLQAPLPCLAWAGMPTTRRRRRGRGKFRGASTTQVGGLPSLGFEVPPPGSPPPPLPSLCYHSPDSHSPWITPATPVFDASSPFCSSATSSSLPVLSRDGVRAKGSASSSWSSSGPVVPHRTSVGLSPDTGLFHLGMHP